MESFKEMAKKLPEAERWAEVVKFMERNPKIMLELMPPTPDEANHTQSRTAFFRKSSLFPSAADMTRATSQFSSQNRQQQV